MQRKDFPHGNKNQTKIINKSTCQHRVVFYVSRLLNGFFFVKAFLWWSALNLQPPEGATVFINIIIILSIEFLQCLFIFLKRNSSLIAHQEQEHFSTILWTLMVNPHKCNILPVRLLPDCVGVSISSDWHFICSFFKPLMYLLGPTSLSRRYSSRQAQTPTNNKKTRKCI